MQITITMTAEQAAAVQVTTDRYNDALLQFNRGDEVETPEQFVSRHVLHLVNVWVQEATDRGRDTRAQRYDGLSPERKAEVDAILEGRAAASETRTVD